MLIVSLRLGLQGGKKDDEMISAALFKHSIVYNIGL